MHDVIAIAVSVRESCINAAIRAHEDAGISGLCAAGRWELAIQALRDLAVNSIVSSTLEEMQD
jgi:pentatricopeptide repeat protein